MIQDNQKLAVRFGLYEQQNKRIDYNYDLISGKVNSLVVQKDQPDQMIHKYEYDAENRITEVQTSTNGIHWDDDAKYFYYHHGPLARVELGHEKVQGVDYAYTIQGWIKGVNSNILNEDADIGNDGKVGSPNDQFAHDAYGYTLKYFDGDYSPIDPSRGAFEASANGSGVLAARSDLFNGNITMMATTIAQPLASNSDVLIPLPQANAYQYDQLNRLKSSLSFDNIDMNPSSGSFNTWLPGGSNPDRYLNTFNYDANGNIENQLRDDQGGNPVDNFQYIYDQDYTCSSSQMRKVNNRLKQVINSATGGTTMNYDYDELGNLIYDSDAQINSIDWSLSGKIRTITKAPSATNVNLSFDYDPSGNRIAKHIYDSSNPGDLDSSTYYLRDAQGNVLSTYSYSLPNFSASYVLKERNLYGSSRLGINNERLEMIGASPLNSGPVVTHSLGLKQFELSNHLGNVITTVSDKKLPHTINGGYNFDYYQPEILNATDYYAFGMPMGGREFGGGDYNYGFNGQIKIDEVNGSENSIEFKFRIHNTRLGRFLSVDPLSKEYQWNSTFAFAENSPIKFIDLEGKERLPAELKSDNSGYTTAIDNTYQNTLTKVDAVNNWSFVNKAPDPGVIKQFVPNLWGVVKEKINNPSSNLITGTGKFVLRFGYNVVNDAKIYSTGLIYGRSAATDLENFGVDPKEYMDAGIGTLTNLFPLETITKYAAGEMKMLGYSEYLKRTAGSEFNKLSKEVKQESLIKFNQKSSNVKDVSKQKESLEKAIDATKQVVNEQSDQSK